MNVWFVPGRWWPGPSSSPSLVGRRFCCPPGPFLPSFLPSMASVVVVVCRLLGALRPPRWRLRRWSHLAVATRPRFLRRAPRPPPVNTWHMLLSPEAGALPPAPGPAPTPESRASFGSTRSDRLDFTTSCPSIARRQEGRFLGQPVSWITSQSARVCQPGPVLQHA